MIPSPRPGGSQPLARVSKTPGNGATSETTPEGSQNFPYGEAAYPSPTRDAERLSARIIDTEPPPTRKVTDFYGEAV